MESSRFVHGCFVDMENLIKKVKVEMISIQQGTVSTLNSLVSPYFELASLVATYCPDSLS